MAEPTLIEYVMIEMDDRNLARMYASFNRWNWPDVLPDRHKPYWWDGLELDAGNTELRTADRKSGFVSPFMDYAEAVVNEDMLQRAWMREGEFAETP